MLYWEIASKRDTTMHTGNSIQTKCNNAVQEKTSTQNTTASRGRSCVKEIWCMLRVCSASFSSYEMCAYDCQYLKPLHNNSSKILALAQRITLLIPTNSKMKTASYWLSQSSGIFPTPSSSSLPTPTPHNPHVYLLIWLKRVSTSDSRLSCVYSAVQNPVASWDSHARVSYVKQMRSQTKHL